MNIKFAAVLCLGMAGAVALAVPGEMERPAVSFDIRHAFACRDVTPKKFFLADPSRKVMEMVVRISANLNVDEKQLDHIVYRLTMPPEAEVADHLPRTELAVESTGSVDTKVEKYQSGFVVGYEGDSRVCFKLPPILDISGGNKSTQGGELSEEKTSAVQHRLLPSRHVILAAGTENRGGTLYFKLRPFSQTTVEGEREFAALLTVPKDWDGDCILVECIALAKASRQVLTSQTFKVGLYPITHPSARIRVEKEAKAYLGRVVSPTVTTSSKIDNPQEPSMRVRVALVGKWEKHSEQTGHVLGLFPATVLTKETLDFSEDGSCLMQLSNNWDGVTKFVKATYTVSPRDPSHIDIKTSEGKYLYGIFKVEDDKLRICLAECGLPESHRPALLDSKLKHHGSSVFHRSP